MASEPIRFSVVVASWSRLPWLRRCLSALAMLDHPCFEVILVADRASLDAAGSSRFKMIEVREPHLARARNAGLASAAGEICAFIDDDAVPEPMWLRRMEEAFRATGASAVVGYVRGRNGISYQSRTASVDAEAETHDVPSEGDRPFVPALQPGRFLKLVGTNMAVRRAVLSELGGFDTMYRFFLEDADLSVRLAQSGYRAAVAPQAEVHHAFAPSSRRTALRAPTDLTDIGRSTAIFLRRHMGVALPEILDRLRKRERARLIRHMVAGTCEPRDVGRLMSGLDAGWREGCEAAMHRDAVPVLGTEEFRAMPMVAPGHDVIAVPYFLQRKSALERAERVANTRRRVTLLSFSLTPVRHAVVYTSGGVWLHRGGVFGMSDRAGPIFRWCTFAERVREEMARVANPRGIGDIHTP